MATAGANPDQIWLLLELTLTKYGHCSKKGNNRGVYKGINSFGLGSIVGSAYYILHNT